MIAVLFFGVVLLGQVSAQAQPPGQKCVVAGRVVNSQTGEALTNATVHLKHLDLTSEYTATSDDDGNFRIEDIEPGTYRLSGEQTGFLPRQYGATSGHMGTQLTLSPGQRLTSINLVLFPEAAISGRVTHEDGNPAPDVSVQLLERVSLRGKPIYVPRGEDATQTNDLGEFRVAKLEPGEYYVCEVGFHPLGQKRAQPVKTDIRPVPTCHFDATTIAGSAPIQIAMGQDVQGVNIRMRDAETFQVRGRIGGDLSSGDVNRVSIKLSAEDNPSISASRIAGVAKDRTFDIAGVAPGSYTLDAFIWGDHTHGVGHQRVEIGETDVNDLIVTMFPRGSIQGTIHVEGTPPTASGAFNLSGINIGYFPWNPFGLAFSFGNTQTKPDGTFSIENIAPDDYELNVAFPSDKVYLKSIRFRDREIGGKELDLRHGASGSLDITLRYGLAEVDGNVRAQNPSSQSGAPIMLVPEPLSDEGSEPIFAGITQPDGSFTAKSIAPGRYRVYAFEQVDRAQLRNSEVLKQLESLGTEVELQENDKKRIQLRLISANAIQQVLTRLGIDSSQ